jgi:hypothetical protein
MHVQILNGRSILTDESTSLSQKATLVVILKLFFEEECLGAAHL